MKKQITILIFLNVYKIINSYLSDCSSSFANDNSNKYSCTSCISPFSVSEYYTCDCGNDVLYDTTCKSGINCGSTPSTAPNGNCSSGTACSTNQKQVLYSCYDVTSSDFPDTMMELMEKQKD